MVDEQKPSVSEFKLAGGAKKRVALNIHGDGDGEAAGDAAKGAGPKVIPRAEDTFQAGKGRVTGREGGIYLPPATNHEPTDGKDRFEAGTDAKKEDTMAYGLNIMRPKTASDGPAARERSAAPPQEPRELPTVSRMEADRQKYLDDMQSLPEAPSGGAYEGMPVEEFGKALLRGMGWQDGKGVRGKQDVAPLEHVKRHSRLGLGAEPADFGKDKRGGEVHYEGGVQKHVRRIGEKATVQDRPGVHVGKVMEVVEGRDRGLQCEILHVGARERGRPQTATVRLLPSEEEVVIKCGALGEIGGRRNASGGGADGAAEARGEKRRDGDRHGDSGAGGRGGPSGAGDEGRRDGGGREGGSRPAKRVRAEDSWVAAGIRVRVVDRHAGGGKLYLKKGVVTDVPVPGVCTVAMDEGGAVLTGMSQGDLETVVPKGEGGRVLVLRGEHRGSVGRLLRKNREVNAAAVLVEETEILKVSLDDIAEFTGHAED